MSRSRMANPAASERILAAQSERASCTNPMSRLNGVSNRKVIREESTRISKVDGSEQET
jgi:hypothetical protein